MLIFSIKAEQKLQKIERSTFKLEKEIQTITEKNLASIFGLEFISSEFSVANSRLDTLAFDNETSSFVIIEYKRDKNYSVIDQGFSYLNLMVNYKADFVLEYNEKTNRSLKRGEVEWSQSKVIFVAPSFTNFQKGAIAKNLPIELWEIKKYENGLISFQPIETKTFQESFTPNISAQENFDKIKEIKVYDEDIHLEKANQDIRELYEKVKSAILNMAELSIKATKTYIAFKAASNVVDIQIQKNSLKLWLNLRKGELEDLKNLAKDVTNIGRVGNGDYEIQIRDDENLEYVMSLVKQAIKKAQNF